MQIFKNNSLKRRHLFVLTPFVIMAVLWATLPSMAGSPFQGEWAGMSTVEGTSNVMTRIVFKDKGGKVYYDTAPDCTIKFKQLLPVSDSESQAAVDSSNGGACDHMWSGRITIKDTGNAKITYTFTDKGNKPWATGVLQSTD